MRVVCLSVHQTLVANNFIWSTLIVQPYRTLICPRLFECCRDINATEAHCRETFLCIMNIGKIEVC